MTQRYYTFDIDLGYVESSRLARLTFGHATGFDSPEDAMNDLKRVLVEIVEERRQLNVCCRKAQEENKANKFCPNCGKDLRSSEPDINQAAAMLLDNIHGMDVDTVSAEGLWDDFEDRGWWLCGSHPSAPKSEITSISNLYQWIAYDAGLVVG